MLYTLHTLKRESYNSSQSHDLVVNVVIICLLEIDYLLLFMDWLIVWRWIVSPSYCSWLILNQFLLNSNLNSLLFYFPYFVLFTKSNQNPLGVGVCLEVLCFDFHCVTLINISLDHNLRGIDPYLLTILSFDLCTCKVLILLLKITNCIIASK